MATKFARHVSKTAPTPQGEAIPGREADQVQNHAGGFVFEIDDWARLDRFLILGSEGNTYYATEKEMTRGNAMAVNRCLQMDGVRVVSRVTEISDAGRAPKNDPALFVLAMAAADPELKTRQAALAALPKVARIGTHLMHFAEFVQGQRGWGRGLRRAVGNWYNVRPLDRLADQVSKYASRDGWSNRDLLRLSHPATSDPVRAAIYDWVCARKESDAIPPVLKAIDGLHAEPSAERAVDLIREHRLPRECIPTELLNDPDVWAALLHDMPLTAMVRNLGKMSSIGVLKPFATENKRVLEQLANEEIIRRARLHPFQVLLALKIYAQGHGDRGKLSWTPVPQIVDALDSAFYLAFKTVVPTGKRILVGLDVSGSMSSPMMNSPLRVNEGAAAMGMTVARTEADYHICAFDQGMRELRITAKSSMADVLKLTTNINGGGTDCALPMIFATRQGWLVDAFIVITDNETWAGNIHPVQALQEYRRQTGIQAKLIVIGMTSTGFTIADPKDAGMLDVVGFDADAPALIADFIRN
jgi:60 kDa SS-A/Ro ribonucleoprotein